MIEFLTGFPDDIIAIAAQGDITEDDYRKILVPVVNDKLMRHHNVRLFIHLGSEFKSFTAGAMWEDTKLGLSHWSRWGRIAVITDIHWVAQAVRLFSPFFRHEVRAFSNADYMMAREWVQQPEMTSKAA